METKNLIGGLLAGAAIGVAIGMLLAPASGEKTQKKLSKKSRKLAASLKANTVESATRLKDKYDEGVEGVTRKGREIVNGINEKISL